MNGYTTGRPEGQVEWKGISGQTNVLLKGYAFAQLCCMTLGPKGETILMKEFMRKSTFSTNFYRSFMRRKGKERGYICMEMKKEQFQDKPLRLFVAVRIPESIRSLLEAWRQRNENQLAFKKWTHREDYHITVQFLGDAEAGRVPEIANALKRASLKIDPFELKFGSFGTFGTAESPRVLWAGVIDQSGGLDKLYEAVTSEMGELGFAKEARPYRPHVTIARKYAGKSPFSGHNLAPLAEEDSGSAGTAEPLIWEVNEFVLFSTHLHEKPMYEILEAVQMKDS